MRPFGHVFIPENADDIDELYQMTDEAMYDIKHKTDKSSYRFID